jgi:tRNA U55 pseudouridine synthase TruB
VGCGAHLFRLRRLVSGRFDVANALQYEKVIKLTQKELEQRVIPFLKLVSLA